MLVNQRAMATSQAVSQYSAARGLEPSEQAALAPLADEVRGQPILDLGVGGGRTVEPLRAMSQDYTGVDYAEAMVAAARRAHPGVRIEHGDATKLAAAYPANHFQLVVFSCNGLGMASHADRLRILAAVHTVLRPGGAFVFSNHNRNSPVHRARFAWPALELDRTKPVRSLVRTARFARDVAFRAVNRVRHLPLAVETPDYAIVNGASHNYGVMLYLIDRRQQEAQLAAAKLELARAYDLAGREITDDTTDDSILYVARKPRTL